jgi:hypothetical protein
MKQQDTTDSMDERSFKGFLILDYRSKKMRVCSKLPRMIKPFEVPIRIDVRLKLPKMLDIVAKGEFEVQPVKVREMMLESI